jgi:hypothetical protein
MRSPLGGNSRTRFLLRCLGLRASVLCTLACTRVGAAQSIAEKDLLVAPLPACYVISFGDGPRPESDRGAFPDTITLTRPFELYGQSGEGHVYAGLWPDSALPLSIPMAEVFQGQLVTWWTATRDSVILAEPFILQGVSIHLGRRRRGVWYESQGEGRERTGNLQARRIPCEKH